MWGFADIELFTALPDASGCKGRVCGGPVMFIGFIHFALIVGPSVVLRRYRMVFAALC